MIKVKTINGHTLILSEKTFCLYQKNSHYAVIIGSRNFPVSEAQYNAINEYMGVTDLSVDENKWKKGDQLEIIADNGGNGNKFHCIPIGAKVTLVDTHPLTDEFPFGVEYDNELIFISGSEAKLVKPEREWKKGDTLEITSRHTDLSVSRLTVPHGFDIGEIVEIVMVSREEPRYYCISKSDSGNNYWVEKTEAKLVENDQAN